MSERRNPSLSDILNAFRQGQMKAAGEDDALPCAAEAEALEHPEGCECPECAPQAECCTTQVGVGDIAQAAQSLEDAKAVAEGANGDVVDAASALKEVADEFIAERAETISKEAQLFGQLFAASCMEEMNKTAALQAHEAEAYNLTKSALEGNGMENTTFEKMAAVANEAWLVAMAKLAGYDSPEDLEEAAGRELAPEEIAALAAAAREEGDDGAEDLEALLAQGDEAEDGEAEDLAALLAQEEEAGDEDLSDEEIQALAEQLAAQEDEAEVEDAAQAANLLAQTREGDLDEELNKAAASAYSAASEAMLAGNLCKTASEAYDLALQALGIRS